MSFDRIIAITRQYGSGGHDIGKALAEKLGISFYDKELISIAAKESGVSPEVFKHADERATNSLLYSLSVGLYNYGNNFSSVGDLPVNDRLYILQHKIIKQLAEKAMINRKTFYRHYHTVQDVVDDINYDIINDVWVQKKPPYTVAASQSADGPELLAVPPFQHSQRKNFAPCFTQFTVYFRLHLFQTGVVRQFKIVFDHPPQCNGSGDHATENSMLLLEIIRKCPFVRVSHRSRSFLYGRFILRKNLPPTAQCRRGQRVRPPLSRAAFSGAGTTGSCPHQRCSFCRRPRGIYSGGGG